MQIKRTVSSLVEWIIILYTALVGIAVFVTACFSLMRRIVFLIHVENDLFEILPQPFPQHLLFTAVAAAVLLCIAGRMPQCLRRRSVFCYPLFFLLALAVTAFSLFLIFVIHPVATNDALQLEQIMSEFAAGNYHSLEPRNYLDSYPFQVFYVLYGIGLRSIFGPSNYAACQLINVLCILISLWLLDRIAWEMFEDQDVCDLTVLLSFGALYLFIYSTYVYNDIPSFPLQIGALYCEILYLKRKKLLFMLPAIVCIALGILMKSNCYIALVAMDAMLVFSPLRKNGRDDSAAANTWKRLLLNVLIAGVMTAVSVAGSKALIAHYSALAGRTEPPAGVPAMAYFAMGAQEMEGKYGWYDGYNVQVYFDHYSDADAASAAALENLKESLHSFVSYPRYGIKFYLYKFLSQWGDASCVSTRELEEAGRNHENLTPLAESILFGAFRLRMERVMAVFHSILMIGSVLYFLSLFMGKKKRISDAEALILLFIFGGMLFHQIWEASGRYTMRYVTHLLPLAACGYLRTAIRFRELAAARKGAAASPAKS